MERRGRGQGLELILWWWREERGGCQSQLVVVRVSGGWHLPVVAVTIEAQGEISRLHGKSRRGERALGLTAKSDGDGALRPWRETEVDMVGVRTRVRCVSSVQRDNAHSAFFSLFSNGFTFLLLLTF